MTTFDCFSTFLALKQHFTKKTYNVIKYNWKVKASLTSFHKRTDRYFFERLSRKKSDSEIRDYFVANFVNAQNPNSIYTSELIQNGDGIYLEWLKRNQSLSYLFKNEIANTLTKNNFNSFFECKNEQHSPLIRKYLQKKFSIETLVIFEKLLHYVSRYDKILDDPVWDSLSLKISKYEILLNIDDKKYFKIIKELICE